MVVASRGLRAPMLRFFAGGVADVQQIRAQHPLPETADELCAVAQLTGAGEPSVHLGAKASETNVKQLSAAGTLKQARIVHFATHGLLAGETQTLAQARAEPALLLTPPDTASETDDGLLTASEVARLDLNADWVILSACNTAGADNAGAEAMSGLARAFFYAGARALLVTHWYVDSDAAVRLTTRTIAEMQRDPAIGRDEALRRAMVAVMAAGDRPKDAPPAAHPSVWAPFVVVGDSRR
jgi:CHAT domain-containing protein